MVKNAKRQIIGDMEHIKIPICIMCGNKELADVSDRIDELQAANQIPHDVSTQDKIVKCAECNRVYVLKS